MRRNLVILTGVLLAAGAAHAQPAPETPVGQPSDAAAADSPTMAPDDATPAPAGAQATEPSPPGSSDAPAPEASPAPADGAGADSPEADGELGEMSAEELAALGLDSEGPAVDTSVHLSGFVDFSLIAGLNAWSETVHPSDHAFAIGNINLYLTKNLTEAFRTMIEVRFMYLPNGAGTTIGAPPTSTVVADYADFGRAIKWGAIDIQRAYLDWQPSSYFTVRVGQFLTPYGVWNVDHGSPTIIPAAKPYVIGVGFFPSRQTGLEVYGRTDVGSDGALGYHLTLSNGTGSVSEYRDLDKNKALGGRAYWETRLLGELRVGGSAYYGTNSEGSTALGFEAGELTSSATLTSQSDALAFGVDAVWKLSGFHAQAEWLCLQRKYVDDGRILMVGPTGSRSFPPDSVAWGMYGLLGYRFDWLGVMPFVMYQNLDQPEAYSFHGYHLGVNVRPIDALAIKLQYDNLKNEDTTFSTGYVQVAWAY